jgi:oligopeptide/dipeptide ABC transporter ATP-binding protein
VQAQILELFRTLKRDRGIALLFISHDLAVIRQIADQVATMYRGRLLEQSPAETFFTNPAHPYSRSLLAFAGDQPPRASRDQWQLERGVQISDDPAACIFLRDCPQRLAVCEQRDPAEHCIGSEKQRVLSTHYVKCHLYDENQGNESEQSQV